MNISTPFKQVTCFIFEEKQKFGIRIEDEENGVPLPFLPIWIGEGGADFASITLMAKTES